ncbi:ATP-binding protein [Candidatus Amarolinea aalborgensis]|uniref:ATP-binding protein n=1 Tax=Candidatus Amarolinea aalborgensis TaxID=2249329 RepID=UPI003BFA06DC
MVNRNPLTSSAMRSAGRSHAREALAGLLWPEYDDEHARAALRRTLSTLRAAVGEEHLAIDRETVALVPGANLWVDVTEFRARLAACAQHGHPAADACPACLAPLAEAAALYRDDFLAGFSLRDSAEFEDWQFMQVETLRAELAEALDKLARIHSAAGDFAAALASARRWLALDPLREEAHRQVMRLYAWVGQRNAALHQYRECVRILEQELGVPPLAETTELYEAIKGNRLPTSASSVEPRPPDSSDSEKPEKPLPAPRAGLARAPAPAGLLPLVGRAAELTALVRGYERRATTGVFVAIEGEAGIGKTRLAEEFLAQVRSQGATTITVRCYEGETNVAYGPVADGLRGALAQSACADRLDALPAHWLAEVARLLPELHALRPGLPPPPPLDAPGAQSRFLEGLRQVLSAVCQGFVPNVLFFDDMHWADAASLGLLAYLVRRLAGQPLFILATWRSDEGPVTARLRSLVADAQRAGAGATFVLNRLAPADVLDMVRSLSAAGADLPAGMGDRLHRETEGLPLFLAAYLEDLAQQPEKGAQGEWLVPRGVADLLRARVDAVGEAARQALQAAAVIGRSFDLEALQATSGRSDEEAASALEALTRRAIVREVAEDAGATPRYDFTHEKLRGLVYDETSLARRRLLHGRAARFLSERARIRRNLDAQAAAIGRHFRLAGQDAEAAACFAMAGDHAHGLYAHAEALAHYQAALALGHPEARRLHEASGDMHVLLGAYSAALASYEAAAALCAPATPALATVEHKLGNVHARRGEWPSAEAHFAAALDLAGNAARRAEAARILADWSLAVHAQGQTERASALASEALAAAESADDRRGAAQAHNLLGILARSRGDAAGAVAHLERSLAIADALADASGRIAALNNLALACSDRGDLAAATALAERALALGVAVGDRHREAALHNNLADLLHAAGRSEEAMIHLKQAVVIFAEIGVQAGDAQPEIWRLLEW